MSFHLSQIEFVMRQKSNGGPNSPHVLDGERRQVSRHERNEQKSRVYLANPVCATAEALGRDCEVILKKWRVRERNMLITRCNAR